MADEKTLGTMYQELSRGTVVLAVLVTADEPIYGYSLVNALQEAGLEVEQNTLYPLLRRLESQQLLESSWNTDESRPRKYYRLTDQGRDVGQSLSEEWQRLNGVINRLINKEEQ